MNKYAQIQYYGTESGYVLAEGANKHYKNKSFGKDYEATMQICFTIYGIEEGTDFIVDIIVPYTEIGLETALNIFEGIAEEPVVVLNPVEVDELWNKCLIGNGQNEKIF